MTKMRLLRVRATGRGYVLLISAVRFSNFVQFIPLHNLTTKSSRTSEFGPQTSDFRLSIVISTSMPCL